MFPSNLLFGLIVCLFFSHDDEIKKNKESIVTDLLRMILRIHLTAGGFHEFWPRFPKTPVKFNTIMSTMMHSRDKNVDSVIETSEKMKSVLWK